MMLRTSMSTVPFLLTHAVRVASFVSKPDPAFQQRLRHLLILDFEATCGSRQEMGGAQEIIEFPTLVYNLERDQVDATFHEYVRPVKKPILTPFCTDLTGITQDVVASADTFPVVWERFQDFLKQVDLHDPDSYTFLTCGDWDLRVMLPKQLATSGYDVHKTLVPPYNRWINIKKSHHWFYGTAGPVGMLGMLRRMDLEVEGRHHSGTDDCKNILRIVRKMVADGWDPAVKPQDIIHR